MPFGLLNTCVLLKVFRPVYNSSAVGPWLVVLMQKQALPESSNNSSQS